MKKFFAIIASAFIFCTLSSAETFQKDEQLTMFNAIEASNAFQVNVKHGSDYSVHLVVDKRVEDFYTVFLNGGTLVLGINEKEYTKEVVKKIFKQKDTSPLVLMATVYIPQDSEINSIKLENSAILTSDITFNAKHNFNIETNETSAVKGVTIKANSLNVKTKKKSTVTASVNSSETSLITENSSIVDITLTGNNLNATSENLSQLTVSGTVPEVKINASGSSKQVVKTTTDLLFVAAKGNSDIDAKEASITNAVVELVSASCSVKPLQSLVINASNNAKLVFDGNPVITIQKINNSTVLPASEVENKK